MKGSLYLEALCAGGHFETIDLYLLKEIYEASGNVKISVNDRKL